VKTEIPEGHQTGGAALSASTTSTTDTFNKWLIRIKQLKPYDSQAALAVICVVLLEIALLILSLTDFTMTHAGLIRHGTNSYYATLLAAAIVFFMFLMWTVILNLAPIENLRGFAKLLPVMILILCISYAGAGQWILIELAGVEATREASTALKREVEAYLAPAEEPGRILDSLLSNLTITRTQFVDASNAEKAGKITGRPGVGPAVERFSGGTKSIELAEKFVRDMSEKWHEDTNEARKKMKDISARIEHGGVISPGEVERELGDVLNKLTYFPFSSVRPQVAPVIGSTQQASSVPGTIPTNDPIIADNYRKMYKDVSERVSSLSETAASLLDQIEAFHLPPRPRLQVKPVRETVWANPSAYTMDIAHSIALIAAPFIYACGIAQVIMMILARPSAKPHDSIEPSTLRAVAR
jgi:hypothetical protein